MSSRRLRVLLVPDSIYWVTGTITKSIARFNPWIEATIASGPIIDAVLTERPDLMRNFDLVHFVCPYSSRNWLPRFRESVPCVTSHHHVTDWELIKHNLDGDAIVVGAPEWAEDLRGRGADMSRVFCVPYGVDAEKFTPATAAQRIAVRRKLSLPLDATVVGFFGKNSSNDDDRKGIDVFTSAIMQLNKRVANLAVLIIGPGWQDLVEAFRRDGISCICFPFIRELDGLVEMYHALDFYWVTARVEGGPVTLLEAMSCEVCCLTTPVGIAREIVKDGENAVLLPFNDATAFVERTVGLIHDGLQRQRIGREGRETILKEMHVGITTQRVGEVYERAFAHFASRQRLDQAKVGTATKAAEWITTGLNLSGPVAARAEVPLNGFPARIHNRVRLLETLTWAEHLILYQQQRAVGLKMITLAWLRNPLSVLPARVLLRRFLPVPLVARIVGLKNGSRRKPQVLATYSESKKL